MTTNASLPKALTSKDVHRTCGVSEFPYEPKKKNRPTHDIIAQERAIRAINMGLGIRKPGYNIYVAGFQGTGKTSVIKSFLEKWSKNHPPANDWVYVYNFDETEKPRSLQLPRGEGRILKKKMDNFIRDLRQEIPSALQSEDYENTINSYVSSSNERKAKLFGELEKLAKSMDFTVKSTRVGIETVPVIDGRTISEKEYGKLDESQREKIEVMRSRLEPEVLDFARKVRSIDRESKEFVETLRGEVCSEIINNQIEALETRYRDHEVISKYLESVKKHILENILDFVEQDDSDEEEGEMPAEDRDRFRKYGINVFVDNTHLKAAPVIIETNPTYYNLFGKIEKNVEHGMYYTDFTMIKNGAIHRANGGYLVINALDIIRTQPIWETLKRVLRNREAFIEDMGEQYSMLPTSGLRPEPFPVDCKVIMIGNDEIYHLLFEEDEEFHKIFKIKADFDYKMPRNKKNMAAYGTFVATRSTLEDLLPFDKEAVAGLIEFGSRLVEDQALLSTQFGEIKDLTIEADFIAREKGARSVKRAHVEEALDQKFYRLNLVEEQLLDMVKNEDILLDVDGERIGQVNGLTVYDFGDFSFGKIGRITCTTSISDDGIINVERASRLSGKVYDKGLYILAGFLNGVLARQHSLGISASVCFEQNYGMIDGDSASTAELIAIISALADIPIRQSFAITGSINQLGDVQPVGGVNEKIEGFHKVCKLIGKKPKGYSVVIPQQNVETLMLHREVRESIERGYLSIYPVTHLWEAFELATGVPLGLRDFHTKTFAPNSALAIVQKRLAKIHEQDQKQHRKEEHLAPPHRTQRAAKSKS